MDTITEAEKNGSAEEIGMSTMIFAANECKKKRERKDDPIYDIPMFSCKSCKLVCTDMDDLQNHREISCSKIKVAGQRKLDLKTYGEGKDLNYTLEINELPKIKLQSLESIKFIDYEINITENEIKKRIDEIAKNQNNFKDKNENEVSQRCQHLEKKEFQQ